MPGPFAHYYAAKQALESTASLESIVRLEPVINQLWKQHSNVITFSSMGPDQMYFLPKTLGVGQVEPSLKFVGRVGRNIIKLVRKTGNPYEEIANIMHWENSLDMYCLMLDMAKNEKNQPAKDMIKAFAYGYYSHAVLDAVIHPIVYRKTRDHPFTHPPKTARAHKRFESEIDTFLVDLFDKVNPFKIKYQDKPICHEQGTQRRLYLPVFNLFREAMGRAYNGGVLKEYGLNFQQLLGKYDDMLSGKKGMLDTGIHPVGQAYNNFIEGIRMLYTPSGDWAKSVPRWSMMLPIESLTNEQQQRMEWKPEELWGAGYSDMPGSILEAFKLAVLAFRGVVKEGEDFLNSGLDNAKQYFERNGNNVPFLEQSYNFDTGLPSAYNKDLRKFGGNVGKILGFGTEILAQNYIKCRKFSIQSMTSGSKPNVPVN